MASTWTLGGIHIYIDTEAGNKSAVRGRLHVLDATEETLHYSGSVSHKKSIGGTLFSSGVSTLGSLLAMVDSGSAVNLTGDQGSLGNWYVDAVDYERVQDVSKSDPTYAVKIELTAA